MPEDKLTKYERLRLEAFAQACNSSFTHDHKPTLDDIFKQAERIEQFLLAANPKLN